MNTTELLFPSNRVNDIERCFHRQLDSLYGADEVTAMIRELFRAFLGWDTAQRLVNRRETINQSDLLRFHWALHDLKHWRPLQHIIGYTDFCDCRIDVDEHTLIPRPETEEMVLRTLEQMDGAERERRLEIADLCTGSGCIAIALAKQLPRSHIVAYDLSAQALERARHNAERNRVAVQFEEADLLTEAMQERIAPASLDLIVSNPPYVCETERSGMSANVLEYEPASALFVPDEDPLRFYRAIAVLAARWLKEGGRLVVEINERLGCETLELFEANGLVGTVETDFRGKERVVRATKPA